MKKLSETTRSLLFLWMLIFVSCLIIFRAFIFGDELAVFKDVGSDTLQQYLMQYDSIVNAIRDGNLSLWDFTNGFGTSIYALNLFHPLLFLLYLAGALLGPVRLPALMVYFEIGQIFLAATALYFYLGEFRLSSRAKVIGAYLYGFNGYLMVWGQHYQFGLFLILLPLLLMLAERAIKKGKFSFALTLGVCVTVLSSVYMAYMTLLTLGLYLLFRIFSMENPHVCSRSPEPVTGTDDGTPLPPPGYKFIKRVRLFLSNCGAILLGLLMMMAVFLPSALYLLNISSRMNKSGSLLERFLENIHLFSDGFYKVAFGRLFSSNLYELSDTISGTGNYYEAPQLFIGVIFVILFFQYLFTIHRQETTSRREKIAQYLAIALSMFFILIQAGSMIFNGFVQAFSRHTFIFMPFAALIIAMMIDQIFDRKRFSYAGLGVSALLFAAFFVLENPGTERASVPFICLLGVLMIAVLVLAYQRKFAVRGNIIMGVLLLLVMTNMIYDGYYVYNDRDTLKKTDAEYFEELYGNDVTEALEYLRENDASFYRVEKDYDAGSYCMDASAQNYFGISTYNSTPNKYLNTFVEKLWPNLQRLTNSMFSYRQTVYDAEMASLVHVKYLLSHSASLDVDGFSLEKQFGTVYLYKNNNTDSIGKFYTETISESEIPDDTSGIDMDQFLTENLIVDGEGSEDASALEDYALEALDYEIPKQTFTDTEEISIALDREEFFDYDRVYADITIAFDSPVVASITLSESSCYYVTTTNESCTVHVRLRIPRRTCSQIRIVSTDGTMSGTVKKIRFYGSISTAAAGTDAEVNFSMPENDTLVEGTVSAATDGVLMVSIPYEDGWTAYVDGEETEVIRADYGFMALNITAGDHEITFRFQAPGLRPGIILSLIGWALFLAALAYSHLHKKSTPKL